jgi:TIR domain/Bacterial Ig-like domain (group 2)
MADIFLSYANEDREAARALAGLLESAGWTVWWDRRIPAGRTWRSMIEEALREMHGMVVLWSTNSVESDWVKEEAEEARALGKLIPVLIESVKPPVGFRSIQAADLTDWDGSSNSLGVQQLIADLESLIGKPVPQKPAEPEDLRQKNSPIAASNVEETRGSNETTIRTENESPVTNQTTRQIKSLQGKFGRGAGAARKKVAAGAFIVVAVLGSLLWLGKKNTQVLESKVPPAAPTPIPAPSLASVGLSADRQEITTNEMVNVALNGQYTDGTQKHLSEGVQWLSSDPNVATIDGQGRVTARQAGQTKITARYGDLMSPAWTLTVRAEQPVIKTPTSELVVLTVSAARREVGIQERVALRVKARYTDGNEKALSNGVEWRVSDASIASIDSRGELLALRPGKIAVVARWGGIESTALYILVKEVPRRSMPESQVSIPVAEPPQVLPAKPAAQVVNVGSYVNRAKGQRVQGNYAAALAELEKARAINPSSQEVLDEIEATRRACNAEKQLGREGLSC